MQKFTKLCSESQIKPFSSENFQNFTKGRYYPIRPNQSLRILLSLMRPLAVSEPILEAEKCDSKLGFLTWSRLSQFPESLVVVVQSDQVVVGSTSHRANLYWAFPQSLLVLRPAPNLLCCCASAINIQVAKETCQLSKTTLQVTSVTLNHSNNHWVRAQLVVYHYQSSICNLKIGFNPKIWRQSSKILPSISNKTPDFFLQELKSQSHQEL